MTRVTGVGKDAVQASEPAKWLRESWLYCPECGNDKTEHDNELGDGYRVCTVCCQEWYTTLDYTPVVRCNLAHWFGDKAHAALDAEARALREALKEVLDMIKPDDGNPDSRASVIKAHDTLKEGDNAYIK